MKTLLRAQRWQEKLPRIFSEVNAAANSLAANSDQVSGNARAIKQQAEELKKLVGTFRI